MLEGVCFNALNVTPHGLEVRVSYDANIRELTITRNIVDEMLPIFEGTVLHEPTGPGDVYRPTPVAHYDDKGWTISQSVVSQSQEVKQPNPNYPFQHHPASNYWFLKGRDLGLMAGKFGKKKNAKDKFNKDKAGKKPGTPKSKGSGPYDRQSVSFEGRKGPDESSLLTVSEVDRDNLSHETVENRDPIEESDDENVILPQV